MERELKRVRQRSNYLYDAVAALQGTDECEQFLSDLLTPHEAEEFANRWAIASLLLEGMTQEEISKVLKVSSTTVSRVNAFVQRGKGGYRLIWDRLKKKGRE